jgi:acetyl esterase/lipase
MDAPLVSWLLLVLALAGAALAWTAVVPGRHLGWGNVAWFLASFLTAELAVFHIVLAGAVLLALVAAGALVAWPGQLGLVLVLASCAALAVVQWRTRPTVPVLEAALRDGLGDDYRAAIPAERLAAADAPVGDELRHPFRFHDPLVEVIRDVPYWDGHRRHRLDLYRPRQPVEHAPVLVQIHGGAWQFGDKQHQGQPLMHFLAARGWLAVAINYRLCPRERFPAPLVDCKRAIAWLREHVAGYGGDPSFIVVTGGSAGAHLATLVALTANRPELQPGFAAEDTSVAACVSFYGVYDFLDREQVRNDRGKMTAWLQAKVMPCEPRGDPQLWDVASPVAQVHERAPPFFLLHGTYDSLAKIEEARLFATRLREVSRSPVAYAELPAAQHAWDLVHSVRAEYSVRAVARFLEWVHAHRATARVHGGAPAARSPSAEAAGIGRGGLVAVLSGARAAGDGHDRAGG